MRGSLGLVIGLVTGAGAMYLTLRPPWGGGATARAPEASGSAGVAVAPADAGVPKGKSKRRPGRGGATSAGATGAGGAWDPGDPVGADEGAEAPEPAPLAKLSAADRAVETRGDAVALPPRKIDMASASDARPLDQGEINATIGSQSGGVRDCVVQGATNTDLRATIEVELLVDGNGRVTKSRLAAPRYLFEHGLLGCAQRALGRMRFPATGAPTLVSFPISLG